MKEVEPKVLESTGLHYVTRIGRPDVIFDQRTKYYHDIDAYERARRESKSIMIEYSDSDIIAEMVK